MPNHSVGAAGDQLLPDRIDIQMEVPGVKFGDIVARTEGESSEEIRRRVVEARRRQIERFSGRKIFSNARMETKDVKRFCRIDKEGEKLLEMVWGYDYYGETRTVDVHVHWLREKIEFDPSKPKRIVTMHGSGYRFEG